MAYADGFYYNTTFCGVEIDDEQLERLLARASEKVDDATFNRSRHFVDLSDYEQEMIKKAVCAEAEAIYTYGESDVDLSGYTIGDVTISGNVTDGSGLISKKAIKYLKNTRLMSRILR